jgi:chromosome segregation ATPase
MSKYQNHVKNKEMMETAFTVAPEYSGDYCVDDFLDDVEELLDLKDKGYIACIKKLKELMCNEECDGAIIKILHHKLKEKDAKIDELLKVNTCLENYQKERSERGDKYETAYGKLTEEIDELRTELKEKNKQIHNYKKGYERVKKHHKAFYERFNIEYEKNRKLTEEIYELRVQVSQIPKKIQEERWDAEGEAVMAAKRLMEDIEELQGIIAKMKEDEEIFE